MGRPALPLTPPSRASIAANAACDRRLSEAIATLSLHYFVETPESNGQFESDAMSARLWLLALVRAAQLQR
jgi:hypothetical protein